MVRLPFIQRVQSFGRQLFDDDTDESKNREHEKEKLQKGKSGRFNDMQHNKGKKTELNNGIRQEWRDRHRSVCVRVLCQ